MRKLLLSTLIVTAFLSGCTTLDDFIEMTPQQRAETLCRNAPQVKSLASQYETYADAAATARENLRRGYLLHRDCRWVRIPDGSHTDCWRDKHGNQHCDTRPRWRDVQDCRDIPVAIDRTAETAKEKEAAAAAAETQKAHDDLYLPCLERAARLLPQDAYYFYDNDLMP